MSPRPLFRRLLVPALLALGLTALSFAPLAAQAQSQPVLTTLHRFDGAHGSYPDSPLTLGSDGNFYAVTAGGGSQRAGTVFRMTPHGQFTTLFAFNRQNGHLPIGRLVEGKDGNFYGVTSEGFNDNYAGTVYCITPQGVLKTLHVFSPLNTNHQNSDGAGPLGGLIQATDGNFYGTTHIGGLGKGVVFRITPKGQYTLLHDFRGPEGYSPDAPLVQASDGNFYGTTQAGGPDYDPHNFKQGRGVIFRMTPEGMVTVLHAFDYPHGADPVTGLTIGSDGAFYGTAASSGLKDVSDTYGAWGYGTLFRMTKTGQYTTLHRFSEDGHGVYPRASLTAGPDGNFYGTTVFNAYDEQHLQYTGEGGIFRMTPAGQVTTLYKFHTKFDGLYPYGGVTFGPDGTFYGTTQVGGDPSVNNGYGYGTIYKLTLPQ